MKEKGNPNMTSCSAHQFVSSFGGFVPEEMREYRERLLYNRGFQSITYEEVKSTATFTNVDELRFRTPRKPKVLLIKKMQRVLIAVLVNF